MSTKAKKTKQITESTAQIKKSESIVIADFTGISVNELNTFRRTVKEMGGVFKVVKKRLLKFIMKDTGIDFEPKELKGQAGVVFGIKDFTETAQTVYKFAKANEKFFKISGGFDLKDKKFFDGEMARAIGSLPGREVLLGQLVFVLSGPIRNLMYVLQERSKKVEIGS